MSTQLAEQFRGIWRLRPEGHWEVVQQTSAPSSHLDQLGELFASMCLEHLPQGTEVTASVGREMMTARCDSEGVLVGSHPAGGNPLMIRTAMSRVEQTSRRESAKQRAAEEGEAFSGVISTRGRGDRMSRSSRAYSPAEEQSVHHISFVDPSEVEVSTSGLKPYQSAEISSPFEVVEDFDPLQFEVLVDVDASEVSADPQTQASSLGSNAVAQVASASAAVQLSTCTWSEIQGYVQYAMRTAMAFIGRTVVANYWREALRQNGDLTDWIEVSVLGDVSVHAAERQLDHQAVAAIEEAFVQWRERCERVIPNMQANLDEGGEQPPWRK